MIGQTGAVVFAGTALLVVAFHLAVILGAPVGHLTMGGRWRGALPLPARLLSLMSAVVTLLVANLALAHGGLTGLVPPGWSIWVPAGFAALAILANIASPSLPERRLWVPIAVVMLVAALALALG